MAIDLDTLNTTFADLRGPLLNSFERSIPMWRELQKKARVSNDGGTYIERDFAAGAPAKGTGIFNGDELLTNVRRKQIKKMQVETHRAVALVSIPKKVLNINKGKAAAIRLVDAYPKTTIEGISGDMNKYILTGQSRGLVFDTSELLGFVNLNGEFSSGIGTGVTNGVLSVNEDPSAQSDAVFGVGKSESLYHFNQRDDVSSFASNGMRVLRQQYRKAAHYAGKPNSGPDLIVMDSDSFANFENHRDSKIRLELVEDKLEKGNLLSLSLGMAQVYDDPDLDVSLFTGEANHGVCYMLNTDFWEWIWLEKPNIGQFTDRIGDQDVVSAKFAMQGNMICTKLTAQGVVTGLGSA
tara:strand:+ start:65 stop:1120 length:1056 start_codon:yes stop_codon:yes gene_type:complete